MVARKNNNNNNTNNNSLRKGYFMSIVEVAIVEVSSVMAAKAGTDTVSRDAEVIPVACNISIDKYKCHF